MVDQALKGNVNAQALYLSRRAGWKETQVVENREVDYDRMSEEELREPRTILAFGDFCLS